MKKLLIFILITCIFSGCASKENAPRETVEYFFEAIEKGNLTEALTYIQVSENDQINQQITKLNDYLSLASKFFTDEQKQKVDSLKASIVKSLIKGYTIESQEEVDENTYRFMVNVTTISTDEMTQAFNSLTEDPYLSEKLPSIMLGIGSGGLLGNLKEVITDLLNHYEQAIPEQFNLFTFKERPIELTVQKVNDKWIITKYEFK